MLSPSRLQDQATAWSAAKRGTRGWSGHDVASGHVEGDAGQPRGPVGGQKQHPAIINTVAFNPHCDTLATSSIDEEVRLWDLASTRQIGPALPEPEHHVTGLPCDFCFNVTEFDPSGSHLIALYQSGIGIVWDVDPKLWSGGLARSPAAP
jgi:WD40 repeat protein